MTRFPLALFLASLVAVAGCNKPRPAASAQPEVPATPAPVANESGPAPAGGGDQGPGGGPGGQGGGQRRTPAERVAQMKSSLGISDDQAQKITAIFEAQRPAMEALRNDQSLSREQRRDKMQELRAAMDSQLSAILTPEQKTKWEEERAKMRERFGNRQGGGPGNRQDGAPQPPPAGGN